jgi:hypothetical protein
MHVVRHEAVRNQRKPLLASAALNLHQDLVNRLACGEERLALKRAKREEIAMETKVIKRLQTIRLAREHAEKMARGVPRGRHGPPVGGHYVRMVPALSRSA